MNLIISVYKINHLDEPKKEEKIVNEVNYLRVKAKLEIDHEQIVNLFKSMKEEGIIQSIYIPKNKTLQNEINKLITIKKDIKNSINKISNVFR